MENINIDTVINKWFEIKFNTYDKLEHNEFIYYYYYGEEYAEIGFDKKDKSIYYRWKIYEEFSEIIPLYYHEFENLMVKWVEDTFGLKGFIPFFAIQTEPYTLKIPKINN